MGDQRGTTADGGGRRAGGRRRSQKPSKILSLARLLKALDGHRACGERIVLTNGTFDLLHVGHVRSLREARTLGDVLVAALNSDASVRAYKGPGRPLVPAQERAEVLAALEAVDYVVIFEEATAERIVEAVRPHVYAKGCDYATESGEVDEQRAPEARVARRVGATVQMLRYVRGRSSSALARRLAGPT